MKVERTKLSFTFAQVANIFHDLVKDLNSSVGHDNETQLVTHVLHFMNLDESSYGVQIRQVLHNIRLMSVKILNETPRMNIENPKLLFIFLEEHSSIRMV